MINVEFGAIGKHPNCIEDDSDWASQLCDARLRERAPVARPYGSSSITPRAWDCGAEANKRILMRVNIAGSRDITDYNLIRIAVLASGFKITRIVSGMARDVDTLAVQYAKDYGIPWEEYPADRDAHGKAAGPIRTRQMAENADALIAIPQPDGSSRGSNNMIETANALKLKMYVHGSSACQAP